MERKSARRKLLRRKYKRYAVAAVAGAAILSGAALPGITATKALAAENPISPPTRVEQKTSTDYHQPFKQIFAEKFKMRDKDDKQAWYKKFHRSKYDRYNDDDRYVSSDGDVIVRYLDSPVDVIKDHASVYGFDPAKDTFTFLSLSRWEASILVTKHDSGERFKVDFERGRHRDWKIVEVSSIAY